MSDTIKSVNLKAIRVDGATQSRVALNLDTVAEYREAIKDGSDLPPVVVFFDNEDYWLADGFHRHGAYTEEGRASIPADVRLGTQREALLFSCGANAQHGLRRTRDDKRNAVLLMLGDPEWSKLSDRVIAQHCSVSNTFVSNIRTPKAPAQPPAPPSPPAPPPAGEKGGETTGGSTGGVNVDSKPKAPTPPAPPAPPPGPTEAEKNAAEAHGDTTVEALLEETQAELQATQQQLAAATADDKAAEIVKWQRLASVAQRREAELQEAVAAREADILRLTKIIKRIGVAVGEDEIAKVAATVELFVKTSAATA